MRYKIDLEDLTLGEAEEFEQLSGLTLEQAAGPHPPMKVITTLLYLVNRRDDPAFTMEDARGIKISNLAEDQARPL